MRAKELKEFIIRWNNTFIYDNWWRRKYNVPFGSDQHKAMCQIDIMLEYLEEQAYKEAVESKDEQEKMKKEYQEGKWLRDRDYSSEDEDLLFDQIDIGAFNNVGSIDVKD